MVGGGRSGLYGHFSPADLADALDEPLDRHWLIRFHGVFLLSSRGIGTGEMLQASMCVIQVRLFRFCDSTLAQRWKSGCKTKQSMLVRTKKKVSYYFKESRTDIACYTFCWCSIRFLSSCESRSMKKKGKRRDYFCVRGRKRHKNLPTIFFILLDSWYCSG